MTCVSWCNLQHPAKWSLLQTSPSETIALLCFATFSSLCATQQIQSSRRPAQPSCATRFALCLRINAPQWQFGAFDSSSFVLNGCTVRDNYGRTEAAHWQVADRQYKHPSLNQLKVLCLRSIKTYQAHSPFARVALVSNIRQYLFWHLLVS